LAGPNGEIKGVFIVITHFINGSNPLTTVNRLFNAFTDAGKPFIVEYNGEWFFSYRETDEHIFYTIVNDQAAYAVQ